MKFISIFFLVLTIQITSSAQNFDVDVIKSINQSESSFKTGYCNFVANSVAPINGIAPATLLIVGLVKHNKKLQIDAAYVAGSYILSAIITHGAKRIIQRDRPFVTYSFIEKRSDGGGYSFPSGHTSAAFSVATSMSLLYPKWYVIVPAYFWASSVGYARMYQGVHYPSDVFVGAIVGAGSAYASYKIRGWIEKKALRKKQTHAAPNM